MLHHRHLSCPRWLRAALALAAFQLLLACAQPPKNQFVSHFRESLPEGEYQFPADPQDSAADADASRGYARPQMFPGTDRMVAAPDGKDGPVRGGAPIELRFEDAPLHEVVRTVLGDILGLDYVLHPPIEGHVTLSSHRATSPDQALNLLEIALQANGMAMVRDMRGSYHVGRIEALRGIGARVRHAAPGTPLAPGHGVILVPLQYIGAGEMATILRPMVPPEALLRVDSLRNMLVLAGSRAQAEGWLELVRTFDINLLEGMSVGVFPLKHVSVDEVREALDILNTSAGGGSAGAAAQTPATARQMAVQQANPIIRQQEAVALARQQGGAAQARQQQALALARQQQAAAAGSGGGAGGSMLMEGNPLHGALRIIPIERLNSVLIITPRAAYLEQARVWLERLDQPGSGDAEARLHIYRVENGNAMHLAEVLSGIFGGTATVSQGSSNSGVAPGLGSSTSRSNAATTTDASTIGGGLGSLGSNAGQANAGSGSVVAELGDVRIMADELNNSILVWGTAADYERVSSALKRLDLPPVQVLIEASIVEVTLNDSLRYGLQWAFSADAGRYSGAGASGNALPNAEIPEALGNGLTYTLRNTAGAVRAALSALASKTSVKVVASPTLMVLDNHTAGILVGTQQPYSAGSTAAPNIGVTTNVQYKDTGVNLQVTPSVNAGNMVTMTVEQTVTDVGSSVVVGGETQPTFLQRQVSSRVAVRSGESIVMGGLIQENARSGSSGLPLLHDLPVLGGLFGTTERGAQRTELVVIITPRVVRSDVQVQEVSRDLRQQMHALTPLLQPPPARSAEVPPPGSMDGEDAGDGAGENAGKDAARQKTPL